MNWNTPTFPMAAPQKQVSSSDLDMLLKGRKFRQKQVSDVNNTNVDRFDPEDMSELEEYCKKRGIIGINFNGMNPKAALRMLRSKVEGIYTEPTKKSVLYG